MEEKKKGFIAWVKAHRKQLLVSGVSVSAILLVILGIKNKETMLDLWNFLENSITKVPEKLPENMNLEHLTLPAIDEDFSVRVYTSPQEAFDVRQHIRNLSGGRQHSIEKAAEAATLGNWVMPVEERELHNNGLSEDTLSVLRDGRNNGNEIGKNNGNLGNYAEARVHIFVSLDKYDVGVKSQFFKWLLTHIQLILFVDN